jgi:hypothetical protein
MAELRKATFHSLLRCSCYKTPTHCILLPNIPSSGGAFIPSL